MFISRFGCCWRSLLALCENCLYIWSLTMPLPARCKSMWYLFYDITSSISNLRFTDITCKLLAVFGAYAHNETNWYLYKQMIASTCCKIFYLSLPVIIILWFLGWTGIYKQVYVSNSTPIIIFWVEKLVSCCWRFCACTCTPVVTFACLVTSMRNQRV